MALRTCPDCGESVPGSAKFCPACGWKMTQPRPVDPPARRREVPAGVSWLILALVIGGAAWFVYRATNRPFPQSAPAMPESATSTPDGEVVLGALGGSGVWLATTDAAFDKMVDAENAQDRQAMASLMSSGKVIRVPGGTRGRIVQAGILGQKVHIAGTGEAGWVQSEFVHR